MKSRTPERQVVVARAREWRALRDARRLSTVRLALRCRMALARLSAIICASVEPTADEAERIDFALSEKMPDSCFGR